MSNAGGGELVTASSDGVTVEKSFEPDDFPVPAIAFVIRSDRDERVSIRMVDGVPEDIAPEDIGFHPKYGAEFWGVEGDTIVFERDFEPDEEYTTVYGLRGMDANRAEEFLTEPTLESVEPSLGSGVSGDIVRDVIGSEDSSSDPGAEAASGPDTEGATTDGYSNEDIASAIEAIDTNATESDAGSDTGSESETDDVRIVEESPPSIELSGPPGEPAEEETGSPGPRFEDGSLVSALAEEIRNDEVDDEELEALRDALDTEATGGSVDARIEHLQTELADLQAYTAALEEFLDENGDAQTLIRDLQEEFETATQRLDDMETKAESAVETAESADDRLKEAIDDAEARLDSELEAVERRLESELGDFESRADDIESRVEETLEDVDAALADIDAEIEERLEMELDELWTGIDEAAAAAADTADDVESLRGEFQSLETELEEATTERIEELERDIEDLESELSSLAEMRDRLASALGGLASDPTPSETDES